MFHNRVHRSSLDDPPTDFSRGSALSPLETLNRSHDVRFRLAVPTPVRKLNPLIASSEEPFCAMVGGRARWGAEPFPEHDDSELSELWLKDDGAIHDAYGGNKPRKLLPLLARALDAGARQLVTFGAAGSHHILATTLLGRALGLSTLAFVVRRPWSPHAERCLTRALSHEAQLIRVGSLADALRAVGGLARRRDTFIVPPGASNVQGAEGYFWAARELLLQIDGGQLPVPDAIVVALGSGGTAAGLLAGLTELSNPIPVIAIPVLRVPQLNWWVLSLARRLARHMGVRPPDRKHLIIDWDWVGRGYGHATPEAERAVRLGLDVGLVLEETYTGKAFAAACTRLRALPPRCNVRAARDPSRPRPKLLFWGTLSTTPDSPAIPPPNGTDERGTEAGAAVWWTPSQRA